ncbi:ABC transporter substrate-binding protein [Roseateles sp. SL47]|jgi:phospholipid transport system substrate-binding protein|uniref:MlaC/ttg2D family ABC transporter substrate-binding protein n=1 Tax=Roseateles sp. SL47 TaxID=2995138 RepID=UPI002270DC98|nr:ABC transporter substrate-binding protein [Roseateles sp. SL47]WAC73248.1 ABC transporter substrate-binding protein [Roseateles sp. SL47]
MISTKRLLLKLALSVAAVSPLSAFAADSSTPDQLIRQLSIETLDAVKGDKAIQGGDVNKIMELVDTKVMPHVDFQRITSSAVGRFWRQASPEQKQRLQDEFKTLLVRTYAGALTQVRDQTIALKPLRAAPEDTEVVVRTEIRGRGDPIQLDYRLEKTAAGWKIYDVNVLGIWLADQYRNSFAQEINANGIDGLIKALAERNAAKPAASAPKKG